MSPFFGIFLPERMTDVARDLSTDIGAGYCILRGMVFGLDVWEPVYHVAMTEFCYITMENLEGVIFLHE